jgi:hypothetical protein
LRRLVLVSALLTLGGMALLVPSSPLLSLLTSGTASSSAAQAGFGASPSTTDSSTTIESMVGFGLIGVGLVLEIFSLFTDVGGAAFASETSEVKQR